MVIFVCFLFFWYVPSVMTDSTFVRIWEDWGIFQDLYIYVF